MVYEHLRLLQGRGTDDTPKARRVITQNTPGLRGHKNTYDYFKARRTYTYEQITLSRGVQMKHLWLKLDQKSLMNTYLGKGEIYDHLWLPQGESGLYKIYDYLHSKLDMWTLLSKPWWMEHVNTYDYPKAWGVLSTYMTTPRRDEDLSIIIISQV